MKICPEIISKNDETRKMKELMMKVKHEKELLKKDKELLMNDIKHEKELREKEIEQKNIYKAHAGYYKKIFDDTHDMVKTTISGFRLLSEMLVNPPAIQEGRLEDILALYDEAKSDMPDNIKVKEIEIVESDDDISEYSPASDEEIEEIKEIIRPAKKKDDDFIEDILQYHSDGKLHKYIGDMIIKIYRKENIADQSIFNSDTSRLTYIISRVLHEEGETKWHIDKGGIKTKGIILIPIMNGLRPLLVEYYERMCREDNDIDVGEELRIKERVLTVVKEIDNETIHEKILKYMASGFYLDNNKKRAIKNKKIDK